MKEAIAAGNDECPVKVRLVASLLYVLATQAPDKVLRVSQRLRILVFMQKVNSLNSSCSPPPCQEQGLDVLNEAIEACAEAIERHKGKLVVKKAPAAVSNTTSVHVSLSSVKRLCTRFTSNV